MQNNIIIYANLFEQNLLLQYAVSKNTLQHHPVQLMIVLL